MTDSDARTQRTRVTDRQSTEKTGPNDGEEEIDDDEDGEVARGDKEVPVELGDEEEEEEEEEDGGIRWSREEEELLASLGANWPVTATNTLPLQYSYRIYRRKVEIEIKMNLKIKIKIKKHQGRLTRDVVGSGWLGRSERLGR
ncbi:hypothetical protein TWF788_004996 [Orbilia oligospora]|uniref:Uncharacterized protein n=1 Tax=Orbilia oligospora TaxID=2813651 RepID=A0A7C8PZE6_ORBOL|nr:hypothetical protein TWF788_004996 [Orbilia oligospora]